MIAELAQISCPLCGKDSDAGAWRERPIAGELPPDEYQCPRPGCSYAFRRERTVDKWKPIRCVRIPVQL